MKSTVARLALYAAMAALLLLFLGVSAMPGFVPGYARHSQLWKGYRTLLVQDSKEEAAAEALTEAGFENFVYRGNSIITYRLSLHTFGEVSAARVFDRFDELDPRLDDYMRRAGDFFKASDGDDTWSVFFIATQASPFLLRRSLRNPLKAVEYRIPEYRPLMPAICIGVFIVFAFFVVRHTRYKPALLGLGALPFIVLLMHGNVYLLCSSALIYFCWAKLLPLVLPWFKVLLYRGREDAKADAVFTQLIVCSAALLISGVTVAMALKTAFLGAALAAALAADFLLLAAAFTMYLVKRSRFEHRPFFYKPLRITKQKVRLLPEGDALLLVALVVFLLLPLTSLISGSGTGPMLPQPVRVDGLTDFSQESLENLHYYNGRGLPNLYDYFCHKAYQESYYYGGAYGFPSPGASVNLSSYVLEGDRIHKREAPVLIFDREWFNRRLQDIRTERSAMRILLEQGRPALAEADTIKTPAPGVLFIVIHCLTASLLFSHVLILKTPLTANVLYGIKDFIQRRKREAA